MSKRINIVLPDTTVQVLNKAAPAGERSRLISQAVLYFVKNRGHEILRERLKAGYLENADRDLKIAEQWFPLEEEAWQKSSKQKKAK